MKKTTEKTNSRSTQNKTENAQNTQNAKNKTKGGCCGKSSTKSAKDCS